MANELAAALQVANPLSVINVVLDSGTRPAAERFAAVQTMTAVHLALAAVLVIFSAWGLRRFSLAGGSIAAATQWQRRRTLRPPLKDRPLVWREMFANRSYSRLARVGRGLLAVLVVLAMLGAMWQFADCWTTNRGDRFVGFAMWMGTILESLGLLLAAAWASNSIAAEREKETWTTLVSTPLEAREIVFGKLAGSLYAARATFVPLALVWFLAAISEPRFIPAILLTLIGLLAAAAAGSMLGIFFSFWCASATRALGATLGSVFGAMTLGTCCIFPLGIFNPLYLLLFPGFATFLWIEAGGKARTGHVAAVDGRRHLRRHLAAGVGRARRRCMSAVGDLHRRLRSLRRTDRYADHGLGVNRHASLMSAAARFLAGDLQLRGLAGRRGRESASAPACWRVADGPWPIARRRLRHRATQAGTARLVSTETTLLATSTKPPST